VTFAFAAAAFILSGFAALVYQIAWQRLLVLPIGADVYSTTVIVTAFMLGLGLGSLAGGHAADRLTRRQNLLMFVAAELAIGLFGFASRFVLYDWLYLRLSAGAAAPALIVLTMFATLAWPTFWMGVSLPFLARAVSRDAAMAPGRVGLLYALNTIGAAAGAFASTWVLMPAIGLDGTIRVAATLNITAAAAVLVLAVSILRLRRDFEPESGPPMPGDRVAPEGERKGSPPAAPAERNTPQDAPAWRYSTWAWLYGLAGFQALSLEILWFRLLGVTLKSSAFTFGTLLTIYLAGLGIGAALESVLLRRIRRPALAFMALQAFVSLYALLSVTVLTDQLRAATLLATLAKYVSGYEPIDAASAFSSLWRGGTNPETSFVSIYLLLPALLVGPPTLAMGASFPLVQKIVIHDVGHVGRRVGTLLLANIAGSTLGSIVTGWLALTYIGSASSLKLLGLVSGSFLVAGTWIALRHATAARRASAMAFAALVTAALIFRAPGGAALWASLHGTSPALIIHNEDASGVSLVKIESYGAATRGVVFVNGIGQSWIPYGNIHSVLGALPAFIHPHPQTAALIGLGSGDTLYSLAGRQELSRVTSIEIIRPQLETLREWERRLGYPALTTLLTDPRIAHVFGDGRIQIMRSHERFDIIEADALRPSSAYSGNLYSVGYFELLRSRLNDRGLAVTWATTSRIVDTFASVFPHVLVFADILVGSETPIRFDERLIRQRLRAPDVQAHYNRAAMNIEQLLDPYLARPPQTLETRQRLANPADLNHDLFPRDEFSVSRGN
jgi:spermidine synthase